MLHCSHKFFIRNNRVTVMKRSLTIRVRISEIELELYKNFQKDNDIETMSIMIRKAMKELIKKEENKKATITN